MINQKENLISLFKCAVDRVRKNYDIFVFYSPGKLSHVVCLGQHLPISKRDSIKITIDGNSGDMEIQFKNSEIKSELSLNEYRMLFTYFCNKKDSFITKKEPQPSDVESFGKYLEEINNLKLKI